MKSLILTISLLISTGLFAAQNAAVVTLIRGQVELLTLGKTENLIKDAWVKEGDVVKTGEKSFVKLVFVDKSQMNIGPKSEMKIEKFTGKDSGVIDLVKGKIRSQVSKDYLQMKDKDKSKLFIKTSNAVLGVRGTDFMVSTNGLNTATVLFEGEVVFNNFNAKNESSTERLEEVVNQGVRMLPGEFSVVDSVRNTPTIPALINIEQKENLEKNKEFEVDLTPKSSEESVIKSVVPQGLDGKTVSNSPDELKKELSGKNQDVINLQNIKSDPNGFISGNSVKPANGSFVHIDSGTIIPPSVGSVLDPHSNTYIANGESGKVSGDGNFIPPKNVEITAQGKILVESVGSNGEKIKREVAPTNPMMNTPGAVGGINSGLPMKRNDVLDPRFVPGGLNDINNFDRNRNGGIDPNNRATPGNGIPGGPLKIDIIKN